MGQLTTAQSCGNLEAALKPSHIHFGVPVCQETEGEHKDGHRAGYRAHRPPPPMLQDPGQLLPCSGPQGPTYPPPALVWHGVSSAAELWGGHMAAGRKVGQGLRGLFWLIPGIFRPHTLWGWVPIPIWEVYVDSFPPMPGRDFWTHIIPLLQGPSSQQHPPPDPHPPSVLRHWPLSPEAGLSSAL